MSDLGFAQNLCLEPLPHSIQHPSNISQGKRNKSSGLTTQKRSLGACPNVSDCWSTLLKGQIMTSGLEVQNRANQERANTRLGAVHSGPARTTHWGPV